MIDLMDKTYRVEGMSCDHCVRAVTEHVTAIPAVEHAHVDLAAGSLSVRGGGFTDDQIATAVEAAGYALTV